jgi:hypothetical protein
VQAAHSIQELQIEKRHWNHEFAGAHGFPKFVSLCGILIYELRNRKDTRKSIVLVWLFGSEVRMTNAR